MFQLQDISRSCDVITQQKTNKQKTNKQTNKKTIRPPDHAKYLNCISPHSSLVSSPPLASSPGSLLKNGGEPGNEASPPPQVEVLLVLQAVVEGTGD